MATCGSKPKSMAKGGMVKKQMPAPKAPKGAQPMSYMKGGMVKKPMPMHKMPDGKMMPGAKHGAAKPKAKKGM